MEISEEHRRSVIEREAALLADALAAVDPATPVPTCPGWTALDLLQHITHVHDFWAHVIGDPLEGAAIGEYETTRPPLPEDLPSLLDARAEATNRLLDALDGRAPSDHAWSWFPPDQTVGFTWRMQTHEATIHRVDAQLTSGLDVSPIDADVAAEGVDHVVDVMWGWVPQAAPPGAPVVELVATDDPRSWRVRPFTFTGEAFGQVLADRPVAGRAARDDAPVAEVTGTLAELDLFLWNRAGAVTTDGDGDAIAALQAVVAAGIG